jgi:hypothetical protein
MRLEILRIKPLKIELTENSCLIRKKQENKNDENS